MLKTGIHTLRALETHGSLRGIFGGRRRLSITLYEGSRGLKDGEQWAEAILHSFADSGGVHKRTYTNRFESFDGDALKIITEFHDAVRPPIIHDVAVSDGRTACDFFEKVASVFPDTTYYASDINSTLFLVEQNASKAVFDASGTLVELVVPPFVHGISRHENFLLYPINFLHRLISLKLALPLLKKRFIAKVGVRELKIWCQRALELATADQRFRLMQCDISQPFALPLNPTVIRAMNILNRSYFSATRIKEIINNLGKAMDEEGLFIVGSNEGRETPVRGAIYKKSGNKFCLLSTASGGPPEINDLLISQVIE